jgi:hypothetical protein
MDAPAAPDPGDENDEPEFNIDEPPLFPGTNELKDWFCRFDWPNPSRDAPLFDEKNDEFPPLLNDDPPLFEGNEPPPLLNDDPPLFEGNDPPPLLNDDPPLFIDEKLDTPEVNDVPPPFANDGAPPLLNGVEPPPDEKVDPPEENVEPPLDPNGVELGLNDEVPPKGVGFGFGLLELLNEEPPNVLEGWDPNILDPEEAGFPNTLEVGWPKVDGPPKVLAVEFPPKAPELGWPKGVGLGCEFPKVEAPGLPKGDDDAGWAPKTEEPPPNAFAFVGAPKGELVELPNVEPPKGGGTPELFAEVKVDCPNGLFDCPPNVLELELPPKNEPDGAGLLKALWPPPKGVPPKVFVFPKPPPLFWDAGLCRKGQDGPLLQFG